MISFPEKSCFFTKLIPFEWWSSKFKKLKSIGRSTFKIQNGNVENSKETKTEAILLSRKRTNTIMFCSKRQKMGALNFPTR